MIKAMTTQSRTSLQFLRGPNDIKNLVLTRNYGAVIAVMLTDSALDNKHSAFRIPLERATEFLEPFCDDIICPELNEQYNQIQLYISSAGIGLIGPLSSARAAYSMKHQQLTPAQAVKAAETEANLLLQIHKERVLVIKRLMVAHQHGPTVFD